MSLTLSATAQALSISTVAQERGNSYGIFGYSGATLGVLAVIVIGLAVALAAISTLAEKRRHVSGFSQLVGVIGTIAADVLVSILLVTWWTQANWSADPNGYTGFGIVIGSLAAACAAGLGSGFVFSILLED